MKKLTAKDIIRLANEGKCVLLRGGRMPAAFLQNMQFRLVMQYIEQGVYPYKKKKEDAPWTKGPMMEMID